MVAQRKLKAFIAGVDGFECMVCGMREKLRIFERLLSEYLKYLVSLLLLLCSGKNQAGLELTSGVSINFGLIFKHFITGTDSFGEGS